MAKVKKDFSLILWVLAVWVIMIILVWLINSKDSSNVKFPINSPKDVKFPETPIVDISSWSSLSWDIDDTNTSEKLLNLENREEIEKEQEQKIQKEIIDAINLAWKIWNPDSCDLIDDLEQKNKCLNNTYAQNASTNNDLESCKKITEIEWKNRCADNYYSTNATKNNDYVLCKKILNEDAKYSCISSIILWKIDSPDFNLNSDICNQLKWDDKSFCENKINTKNDIEILWNATDSLDLNQCKKIVWIDMENKCLDVINFKIAVNNKDITKCYLVKEVSLKDQCTTTLSQILK